MRLLLIGGTEFVGRNIVEQALPAGHEVTVFHRGRSEPVELAPVEHVHGDRDGDLGALAGRTWDAVVDVCGYVPRIVRASAETLAGAVGRYCFISTESVYAEPHAPVVTEDAPLATTEDPAAEEVTDENYGGLKVLCEQEVQDVYGERSLLVRPGYVVGPHDTTDRFTSWVRRASRGGRMLAPGEPEGTLQFVDARDLGAFVVRLLELEATGAFNGDGVPISTGEFLRTCVDVAGSGTEVVWVPTAAVLERDLAELFPVWEAGLSGSVVMEAAKARAAGLRNRPVEETVRATLEWDRARGLPEPMRAGPTPEREAELLAELA